MNRVLEARLRTQWPVAAVIAILLAFVAVLALVQAPLMARFEGALGRAGSLGAVLDPARGAVPAAIPPRVYTLLMENSAPPNEADAKALGGTLGAELVQQLSSLATLQHLDVVVAEPGQATQQAGWNEARAHLRMRGTWARWMSFLDALSHSGRLLRIERFSLSPGESGDCDIEVWVSSATLKRRKAGS